MDEFKVTNNEGAYIYRRIIEANDSCLFNSLGLALKNSLMLASEMRQIVARAVLADPLTFSEVILGKTPLAYSKWIQQPQSWGGAIEMMVLSDYFKCEIAACDVVNVRFDYFGQGRGYDQRVYLIYSGIHYDLCVKNYLENGE